MHGADTELDRQVLDLIKDPLTHMVRNSADHGLETPSERAAPASRSRHHSAVAYHEGGHIIICIARQRPRPQYREDQGQGDLQRSRHRGELEKMTEAQIHKFIFAPGFSTAAAVTSVSGPRRRHGRGAHQYRPDRRHHRDQVGGRRGLQRHRQDPADASLVFGA